MVSLSNVRTHNATLKTTIPKAVAVFVGGTSGIGLSTATEFVRNTQAPHVYLVGRNEAAASETIRKLTGLNPESRVEFLKSDISLLRNVDDVCAQIKAKEQRLNLLFMTSG